MYSFLCCRVCLWGFKSSLPLAFVVCQELIAFAILFLLLPHSFRYVLIPSCSSLYSRFLLSKWPHKNLSNSQVLSTVPRLVRRSQATQVAFGILALTYHILDTVVLEVPRLREMAISADGSAMHVALFPSMFSYGIGLPFPCLVRKVLYHLGLAPAQLHPNSWQILICCCILWR